MLLIIVQYHISGFSKKKRYFSENILGTLIYVNKYSQIVCFNASIFQYLKFVLIEQSWYNHYCSHFFSLSGFMFTLSEIIYLIKYKSLFSLNEDNTETINELACKILSSTANTLFTLLVKQILFKHYQGIVSI